MTSIAARWGFFHPGRFAHAYRTAYGRNLRRGLTISRADVAHLMLGLITDPESAGQTVGIAS